MALFIVGDSTRGAAGKGGAGASTRWRDGCCAFAAGLLCSLSAVGQLGQGRVGVALHSEFLSIGLGSAGLAEGIVLNK